MQSHDDSDSNKALSALRKLAEEMTARGENLITAGAPSERVLLEMTRGGFAIRRLPDDPFALRISIGEAEQLHAFGSYLVFRGEPKAIVSLLRRALNALNGAV